MSLFPPPGRARANRKGGVCARASGEGDSAQDREALLAGPGVPVAAGALGPQAAGGWSPLRPHPARARPGPSLPATPLGSRAAAAVPLPLPPALAPGDPAMPVRTECPPPAGASAASAASLIPPPPINTQQPGVATSLLYSGSKFRGHQKSKGNSYDVEVVLQVSAGPRRAGARGPPRGAHWPCPPPAPRARSRGPGPRRRASCTRRFTPGTCPAGVSHFPSPNPDLPLTPEPVVGSSWPTLNTLPDSKPVTGLPGIRKPPVTGHPQT